MAAVDFLDRVKTYLENNGFSGREIRTAKLPPEPERVIAIAPIGGIDPELHIGTGEPSEKRPEVQVAVRDDPKQQGRAWSDVLDVYDTLHDSQPTDTELMRALEGGPNETADDANGSPVYTVNFEILIVE